MMISDIVQGYHYKDQVVILQSQNAVCTEEKEQLILLIDSHDTERVLLQTVIDNQNEEKKLEAVVAKNAIKIEKNKAKKWKLATFIEGGLIILLILAL